MYDYEWNLGPVTQDGFILIRCIEDSMGAAWELQVGQSAV